MRLFTVHKTHAYKHTRTTQCGVVDATTVVVSCFGGEDKNRTAVSSPTSSTKFLFLVSTLFLVLMTWCVDHYIMVESESLSTWLHQFMPTLTGLKGTSLKGSGTVGCVWHSKKIWLIGCAWLMPPIESCNCVITGTASLWRTLVPGCFRLDLVAVWNLPIIGEC